jgi:hypothetical protein
MSRILVLSLRSEPLSVAQVDVARQNVSRGILVVRKFPFLWGIRSTVQWVKLSKTKMSLALLAIVSVLAGDELCDGPWDGCGRIAQASTLSWLRKGLGNIAQRISNVTAEKTAIPARQRCKNRSVFVVALSGSAAWHFPQPGMRTTE